MTIEGRRPFAEQEAHEAGERLKQQFYQLVASRGINAEAVLARRHRITVTLDYFFDDESVTVTPEALQTFIGSIYQERQVGLKELQVSFYHSIAQARLSSSIGLTISNRVPWTVEEQRSDEYTGIVVPQQQRVLSEYLMLFPSEVPLRYALTSYALSDWLQYADALPVQSVEGVVPPAVVAAVASLLPDQDIHAYRTNEHHPVPDPDLTLPPPHKLITISQI